MTSKAIVPTTAALVIILGLSSAPRTFSQDEPELVRPKVVRTMDGGGVYYQTIGLKNASFRFSEDRKQVKCESELVDFAYDRNAQGHLNEFSVGIRAEPQRWLPAPKGGQAASLPGSRSTSYADLDGDSELDYRVKLGPGLQETSILYNDAWVQVGNSKSQTGTGTTCYALDGRKFRFEKGKWNLLTD